MSYTRFPRAAVALDVDAAHPSARAPKNPGGSLAPPRSGAPFTLWSSRPFRVKAGNLVAVRLRDGELAVKLVRPDGTAQWCAPHQVLTEAQAAVWVQSTAFRR